MVTVRSIGYFAKCNCDLNDMQRNNLQGRSNRFQISKWQWDILVSIGGFESRVEIRPTTYYEEVIGTGFTFPMGSFALRIVDSRKKEVLVSSGDIIGYKFSSRQPFKWTFDANLPNIFCVELEFTSIQSYSLFPLASVGNDYYFDGYERKLITPLRELKMSMSTLPDIQFTIAENTLNIHHAVIESKSFIISFLFDYQSTYNRKNSISMDANLITPDVLNAFEDFLYDSSLDDDVETHAQGLLELARCYMINDLTSIVTNRLVRDVNSCNIDSRIILAVDYELEELKNVCREFLLDFEKLHETKVALLDSTDMDQEMIDSIFETLFEE